MNDNMAYVINRAVSADALISLMKLEGQSKRDFINRHYAATIHALACMGMTNGEVSMVLKDAETAWRATAGPDDNIPWPYPTRLEGTK